MRTLSTGQPSTLKSYRDLAFMAFGHESKAVAFLDAKIAEQGEDEEVIAEEGQMLHLLMTIHDGDV